MFTAYQIEELRRRSEQLVDPIINFLIEDIARRVSEAGQLTSTASYQTWQLQKLGVSQKKLKKEIAKRLKISQQEAEKLLTQAAETGYDFDISRFPAKQGIPLSANKSLQQVLDATVKLANEDLANITQTLGFIGPDGICRELTDAYNQACDFAFQKVTLGAQDPISAIRDAVKNLADKGIRTIDYESGVHTSLEAAVRRNMMGGLGLMQEQISQSIHDDLGCDGWEISAHAGSAPDHEPIQGRQYSDKEFEKLNNSLVRRIGTLNCGHSAMPIILGVNEPQYTNVELEDFRQKNEEGVTFDGKHYTLYEATQRQRKFERTIRKQKRRILVDEATGDKEKLLVDQVKLQRLKQEYTRFSKGVGLPAQHARMEAAGFDWKKGREAEKVAKLAKPTIFTKKVENFDNYVTIKTETTNGAKDGSVENNEVAALHHITRLDIEKYKCVSEDIVTDEVIITDERIQHIKDRHPDDYERFSAYISDAIDNPDYIIEDKQPATAMVLKRIEESGEHFRLAIRLVTSNDNPKYKNSVITFLKIREKEWRRLIKNKKILYKAE